MAKRPWRASTGWNREHPVFAGVFERSDGQVEGAEIYRYAPYRAGGGAQTTLIGLTGGGAFVQEIRHGSGGVLLFTSALDGRWNSLPTRGLFVPLLHRSLFYLTSPEGDGAQALVAGRPLRLQVGGRVAWQRPTLTGPDGEAYVPDIRPLFGSTLVETADPLSRPGLYTLEADGAVARRIAVTLDARESDPRTYGGAEAREALAQATGLEPRLVASGATSAERAQSALRTGPGGREIWNILLWVALLFLAAEMIVSWQRRPVTVAA